MSAEPAIAPVGDHNDAVAVDDDRKTDVVRNLTSPAISNRNICTGSRTPCWSHIFTSCGKLYRNADPT